VWCVRSTAATTGFSNNFCRGAVSAGLTCTLEVREAKTSAAATDKRKTSHPFIGAKVRMAKS